MATLDKNQAIIDFLIQCPPIASNPLFFNLINAKDNNKQIITAANDKATDKKYIDGSVLKRYSFTIIDFKSITYNAIVKQAGYSNENVEDLLDVQAIADWITEQADSRIYPNFGEDCIIEDMKVLTDSPNLNGIDYSVKPSLAKYSLTIQIEYLDTSKVLWK